ncbi:uncharacterized protein DS421_7g211110 [Arachis hypogaea]|nr:uncharacterized protein DS421_7g211110 [Arachis hypogaea]
MEEQELPTPSSIFSPFVSFASIVCRGSMTNSFKVSFTFSKAPISSKVTPISLREITSSSFSQIHVQ